MSCRSAVRVAAAVKLVNSSSAVIEKPILRRRRKREEPILPQYEGLGEEEARSARDSLVVLEQKRMGNPIARRR